MADPTQFVYFFGGGQADGSTEMKNSLGGKGANLAEMTRIGVQVPAGFTIPTEVCNYFSDNDGAFPEGLKEQVVAALERVEEVMGARLGSDTNPLLVSCRSGARESMPGMMDTVLNIGLNDHSVQALAEHSGNAQFAWDSYRRFIQMFGDVVLGVRADDDEHEDPFERLLEAKKASAGVKYDSELSAEDLQELVSEFKALVKQRTGQDFPEEPIDQIWAAIGAVFGSWNNDRAFVYRRDYGIPHSWGTACNVQAMVYGNLGDPFSLTVSAEQAFFTDYAARYYVGGEAWINNMLALRAGYKSGHTNEAWSVGAGLRADVSGQQIKVDVSLSTADDFEENPIRLTIGYGF